MGIGPLGSKVKCPECDEEFSHTPSIVFKRKFRWTLEGETNKGKFEPFFVKVQARPTPDIEETEINYLSSKTWVPGKQNWERITVTSFGMDNSNDFWKTIVDVLHNEVEQGECPPEKYGSYTLKLYDGCGCLIESWVMSEAYISKIAFGELDFSSSEETTVEFDISYKKVVYKNNCGPDGTLTYLPSPLGGGYKPNKATCPKCKHEFEVASHMGLGMLGNPNIIF